LGDDDVLCTIFWPRTNLNVTVTSQE
jgi:hypothetical protein